MSRKNTKFNFEESLASLEGLVEAMEAGDLSQQALDTAEQKVQLLLANTDVPTAAPFDDEDDGESAGA